MTDGCIERGEGKTRGIERKATTQRLRTLQRLRAVFSLADLLPEVDDFQVVHSDQSTQLQTLNSVPSHGQLVHCTQSLQHSRDVREVVKGEPQAVELEQATQLFRQGAEVVSIQKQRLQATR